MPAPPSSPAAAPTSEADRLADEAVALFQPMTGRRLTREDGREITRNLSGFFRTLLDWDAAARGARPLQPGPQGE